MKQLIASLLLCMVCSAANAQSNAQYLPQDSVKVTNLIKEGRQYLNKQGKNDAPLTLFFARKLLGLPYVAHTLDKNKEERLVINLREMDSHLRHSRSVRKIESQIRRTSHVELRHLRLLPQNVEVREGTG